MRQIGVLAVLFVVLLAAVIAQEASRPTAGSLRDQVPLQRLGPEAFEADDVQRVEIAGPGATDPFALVRADQAWVVEGDFRAPASAGAVERLLEAVTEARGELRLDDAAAFAKFDLTPERASTMTLRDGGGSVLADFALGRSSGTQGAFVRPRFDGVRDGAYAVAQDLRGALGLPRTRPGDAEPEAPEAAHFHDRNLPSLALESTTRLELTSPNWTLVFEKAGVEWAAVEGDPGLPLRPSGIKQLLSTLGGSLAATELVDPARRAELGLDEAPYRVTAVLADGSRRSAVGAADREGKSFYLRLDVDQDPDVVYGCTQYTWERVFPPGSQLFEMSSLGVTNKGLGQVRIERDEDPLALTRPSNDMNLPWEVVTPQWPLPPRDTQLRNYATQLNAARPIDWYAGDAAFEEQAVVRWGQEEQEASELAALRIGQEDPAGVGRMVVFPDTPERVVVLADATVERLLPPLLSLFDERPLTGAVPADVTRVVVRSDAVNYELVRDEDGEWTVIGGSETERGATNAIASWIDDLIGIEVTGRPAEVSDTPTTIEVHRGDDVLRIGVGPEEDGGTPITLDDAPFVTDTSIDVPARASLVAPEETGENPGSGGSEGEDADEEQTE